MTKYNVDGLKNGIFCAQRNIEHLKQAIKRERNTIKDYEKMIKAIEEKKEMDKAIAGIEIVQE